MAIGNFGTRSDGAPWRSRSLQVLLTLSLIVVFLLSAMAAFADDPRVGKYNYDDWDSPDYCGTSCHIDFYRQWQQAMMSQSYTHHWDEIEYFKLAVPHADRDPKVAEVKAGCNGCHTPMSYLANDVPPPLPEENSRANEGVHCDFCHTVTGIAGDTAFNFNWVSEPGPAKYGPRGSGDSPARGAARSRISWALPNFAAPATMK